MHGKLMDANTRNLTAGKLRYAVIGGTRDRVKPVAFRHPETVLPNTDIARMEPLLEDRSISREDRRDKTELFREIVAAMRQCRLERNHTLGRDARKIVRRAYVFADKAHEGQKRGKTTGTLTDTPYIVHPLEIGMNYAKIGGDYLGVAAAILHDTLEQGFTRDNTTGRVRPVTVEDIEEKFGLAIAHLVRLLTPPKLFGKKWIFAGSPNYHRISDEYKTRRSEDPTVEERMLDVYWNRLSRDPTALMLKILDFNANLGDIDNLSQERKERYFRKVGSKMPLIRVLHRPLYEEMHFEFRERSCEHLIPEPHPTNLIRNAVIVAPARGTIVKRQLLEHLCFVDGNNTSVYYDGLETLASRGIFDIGCPRNNGHAKKPFVQLLRRALHDLGISVQSRTSLLPVEVELSERIFELGVFEGDTPITMESAIRLTVIILEKLLEFHSEHIAHNKERPKLVFMFQRSSMLSVAEELRAKGIEVEIVNENRGTA